MRVLRAAAVVVWMTAVSMTAVVGAQAVPADGPMPVEQEVDDRGPAADPPHVDLLVEEGVSAWNRWRQENPATVPNLSYAFLRGGDLVGVDFHDANLGHSNLIGAFLADADLSGSDARDADLAGADLAGANLAGADLAGANLAGADLAGANLAGADLAGANLTGADLTGANLTGCKDHPVCQGEKCLISEIVSMLMRSSGVL